jgi:hypothetical protein
MAYRFTLHNALFMRKSHSPITSQKTLPLLKQNNETWIFSKCCAKKKQ